MQTCFLEQDYSGLGGTAHLTTQPSPWIRSSDPTRRCRSCCAPDSRRNLPPSLLNINCAACQQTFRGLLVVLSTPGGTEDNQVETKPRRRLGLEVKTASGKGTLAQSLSCSKSFLLGFPRLGLHPEVDCCVLIYSLRGCSESYLTTGLIGVYYCQPTVAIRTARRSGWVDGCGSSPALPNPALTQSKHLKGGHWIRCRGDSPGFCLSEGFLLV